MRWEFLAWFGARFSTQLYEKINKVYCLGVEKTHPVLEHKLNTKFPSDCFIQETPQTGGWKTHICVGNKTHTHAHKMAAGFKSSELDNEAFSFI